MNDKLDSLEVQFQHLVDSFGEQIITQKIIYRNNEYQKSSPVVKKPIQIQTDTAVADLVKIYNKRVSELNKYVKTKDLTCYENKVQNQLIEKYHATDYQIQSFKPSYRQNCQTRNDGFLAQFLAQFCPQVVTECDWQSILKVVQRKLQNVRNQATLLYFNTIQQYCDNSDVMRGMRDVGFILGKSKTWISGERLEIQLYNEEHSEDYDFT
ncbi:hypothetical protein SS50377_25562 [Spironucleus salmonicida]|uniref:Uncharacterized protein n=1 Tax=Spironucleus salmonicida TaxID=348837 RepID=V6LKE0_9EUKA|nr:hypothetical protein SS50377_25562 [Spironucleus salmonicida]|eukprot:EST45110.1 Hypothetical protein SS50377_15130 [Spironucleus salmonicida]